MTFTSPTLTTDRLTLREMTRADDGLLHRLVTNQQVRAYLGGPISSAELTAYCDALHSGTAAAHIWTVLNATKPIGIISLSAHKDGRDIELSYQFTPESWGHGYATEAGRAVLDHALHALGLPRVIAETQVANVASTALLTRLGMIEMNRLERFGATQAIFATQT